MQCLTTSSVVESGRRGKLAEKKSGKPGHAMAGFSLWFTFGTPWGWLNELETLPKFFSLLGLTVLRLKPGCKFLVVY